MNRHTFAPIQTALVPFVYEHPNETALQTARALAQEVIVIGVVRIPLDESLSGGASKARELRRILREVGRGPNLRVKTRVIVSHQPWADVVNVIRQEKPGLLLLDWAADPWAALGVTPAEMLIRPPCDVALVRGPFPSAPRRVLVPVRGGPHAELAVRLSLSLRPAEMATLHIRPEEARADAPFRGLERILHRLPEVRQLSAVTTDAAQTILEQAGDYDLIVRGATAQPLHSSASLGPVADRILHEAPTSVIAVKTRRPMPTGPLDETVGTHAISILVDKWFAENTFHAGEFADVRHLVALKEKQGLTISLALPALNEEATVGRVIETMQRNLMTEAPLLDEIVLIDSDSTDQTRAIAAACGVPVHIHQRLLPALGARPGKGEALWKSLLVTRGDLLVWIDTDILNIAPRFVYGILGPMLLTPRIQFVKGFYRRPLKVGEKVQAGGGGRVTELTARPLLNLFYPELSGIIQPLSGEYGGRRRALERLPFFSGYGVETGLLIDIFEQFGLEAIAQVDLLERIHHNQPLEALSKMSFAILQAVIRKLERRYGRSLLEDVNKSMKLIRHEMGGYALEVEEIVERERPPMLEVAEYSSSPTHCPSPPSLQETP